MHGAHRDVDAPTDSVRTDHVRPPAPAGSQLTWESTMTVPTEFVPYVYTDDEVRRVQSRRRSSVASVACGSLGLLLGLVGVWGVLLALAAVVLAAVARNTEPNARTLWMTGLVTGLGGCALAFGWFVFVTVSILP